MKFPFHIYPKIKVLIRSIILSIFIFFIASESNSQIYIHFPDTNAIWHETYIFSPPPQYWNLWYNGIGETYYDGDTLINELQYHKLYRNERNIFCSNVIQNTYYVGALREDTIESRIYALDFLENEEHLLYDFTLKPGDPVPFSDNAVVESVDTIITNDGVTRRKWIVNGISHPGFILEGIGGSNGLLSNMLRTEYPDVTMCFEGDEKQIVNINSYYGNGFGYCNVPTDSCFYLEVDVSPKSEMEIFPNPIQVAHSLQIKVSKKIEKDLVSIELINIMGECTKKESWVELSNIEAPAVPGLYYIIIKSINSRPRIKKIIVTN